MMRKRVAAMVLVATMVQVVLAACTDDAQRDSDVGQPSAGAVDCPDDIEAQVLVEHSCALVDVSGTVSIHVVRVEPPTPSDAEPVLVTGTNLGSTPDYGGLAPIAQRTGRVVLIADLRGTGHSTPLLDCPEAAALAAAAASDPDGARRSVVAAVSDCRDRLLAAGTDPADFSVERAAADLHVVLAALDVPNAVALSTGSTGTVALAWAQLHPGDVAAMVLDSPVFTDPPLAGRADEMVADVAADCAADSACARRYGDVDATWVAALRASRREPMVVRSGGTRVDLDTARLRRAIIWAGGGGDKGAGIMPALIAEAASGKPGPVLDQYATDLGGRPPYCVGYFPKCEFGAQAYGASLSFYCPTILDNPVWTDICRAWGAGATPPELSAAIEAPTLVLTGKYAGYATTAETRAALNDLAPDAFYVEDPAGAHNVLGQDCMREVRTGWLSGDVREPPATPPCLTDRAPDFP